MPVFTNAGGGGGLDPDGLTAVAADVLKGKTAGVRGIDEPVEGKLELTGDAADSTVLSGKTYYNTDAKTKRTGSMANQGAKTAALNCGGSYTIPAGYHNGAGKVTANSLAGQTGATATAGNILSGKTAWVNGTKITGNIASMGAQMITPGGLQKTVSCSGKYMTGDVIVSGSSSLTSNNIRNGVNLFGVTGTLCEYRYHSGSADTSGYETFSDLAGSSRSHPYFQISPTEFGFADIFGLIAMTDADARYAMFVCGNAVQVKRPDNSVYMYVYSTASQNISFSAEKIKLPTTKSGKVIYWLYGRR